MPVCRLSHPWLIAVLGVGIYRTMTEGGLGLWAVVVVRAVSVFTTEYSTTNSR